MIKIFSLTVIGIALLCLQVLVNPNGYNYGVLFLLALAVAYFNEVKIIHAGWFKLEKYERISKHLDESIVSTYQFLLNVTFYIKKSTWDEGEVLLTNYNELRNIFEDIAKLPNNLKVQLNIDVKEYAIKSAYLQKRYLEGHPDQIAEEENILVEISEIKVPPIVKAKPDFMKAVDAYNYLLYIAKNGINL